MLKVYNWWGCRYSWMRSTWHGFVDKGRKEPFRRWGRYAQNQWHVSSHSNYTKYLVKISLDSAITGINPHYLFNFWPTLKKKRATNRRHTFLIRIMLAQTIFFCNPVNHQSHKSHIHQIFWPSRPPTKFLYLFPNYSQTIHQIRSFKENISQTNGSSFCRVLW